MQRGLETIERNARDADAAHRGPARHEPHRLGQGAARRAAGRSRPRSSRRRVETVRPAADAKGIRARDGRRSGRRPGLRRSRPPAAGGLEPAVATRSSSRREGGTRRRSCCERGERRTSRSASPTPASASGRSSCRTCSSASARPTRRPRASYGGLGLGLSIVKQPGRAARRHRARAERGRGPGRDVHRARCRSQAADAEPRRCAHRGRAAAGAAGVPARVDLVRGRRCWSSTTRPMRASSSSACSRSAAREVFGAASAAEALALVQEQRPTCSSATSACRTSTATSSCGACARCGRGQRRRHAGDRAHRVRALGGPPARGQRGLSRARRQARRAGGARRDRGRVAGHRGEAT